MTISESIEVISKYFEKNIDKIIIALIHDCGISSDIINIERNKTTSVLRIDYNEREYWNEEFLYSDIDGERFLIAIINQISQEEKKNICDFAYYLEQQSASKYHITNTKNTSPIETSDIDSKKIIINNTNNNLAQASNENVISISTLSQLSAQVSQSTAIENKQEIQNLISQFEDAKDSNDKESYFDLFFKLLDKLSGSGLIPEWLVKSAKLARNFLDK